jgi:hypothetical protein
VSSPRGVSVVRPSVQDGSRRCRSTWAREGPKATARVVSKRLCGGRPITIRPAAPSGRALWVTAREWVEEPLHDSGHAAGSCLGRIHSRWEHQRPARSPGHLVIEAYSVVVDRLLPPVRSGSRGRGPCGGAHGRHGGLRPMAKRRDQHERAPRYRSGFSPTFRSAGLLPAGTSQAGQLPPFGYQGTPQAWVTTPILWRGRTLGSGWRRRAGRTGPPTWRTRWARYPTGVTTTGPGATSRLVGITSWPDAVAGWSAHRKETGSPFARGRQLSAGPLSWNGRCCLMLQS